MCMEDVKIARKKWFRQTTISRDAGEAINLPADARRVGVSVATDVPVSFSINSGQAGSSLAIASNPTTGGGIFVDIEQYGQLITGPLVVTNSAASAIAQFTVSEIFLNETESKDL